LDTLERWVLWAEGLPQEVWTDIEQKQFWGVMVYLEFIHYFWLLLLEIHCLLEEANCCFPQLGCEQTCLAVKILTHKNAWFILTPLPSLILGTNKPIFVS